MSLIEAIGFIIVMIAMIILTAKRSWEQRQQDEHTEEDEKQAMQNFLKALHLEGSQEELEAVAQAEVKKAPPPVPPPLPKADVIEKVEELPPLEGDIHAAYGVRESTSSYGRELLAKEGADLRKIIILKEILGSPKAFRE